MSDPGTDAMLAIYKFLHPRGMDFSPNSEQDMADAPRELRAAIEKIVLGLLPLPLTLAVGSGSRGKYCVVKEMRQSPEDGGLLVVVWCTARDYFSGLSLHPDRRPDCPDCAKAILEDRR